MGRLNSLQRSRLFSKSRPGVARLRGASGYYVDGLTAAKKALADLPEAFREVAADTIEIGSRIILAEAAARAPVGWEPLRPGHVRLKPSLGREVRSDGLQASVGSGDFTAPWVEFGTKKNAAKPFLWPAYRLGARFVRRQMRNWAQKAGEKVRTRQKLSSTQRAANKAPK